MNKKSKLILLISEKSNKYGNLLIEFMDEYKLNCLKDSTEKQLSEFIQAKIGEI